MSINIHCQDFETGENFNLRINEHVDLCPICNKGASVFLAAHFVRDSRFGRLQIIYHCSKSKCKNIFVGRFEQPNPGMAFDSNFYLKSVFPISFIEKDFSSEIKKISPSFEVIYNQSKNAEEKGLKEIAGGGYRKALEFLVKDYLISKVKIAPEKVKSEYLGPCIDKYIKDEKIRSCAKRAAWLGNDEIHFYRIWEEKDISDLKKLIQLTVFWIDSEVLTEQYGNDMPDPQKRN